MRIAVRSHESKSCMALRSVLADIAGAVARATAQVVHLEEMDPPESSAVVEARALVTLHWIHARLASEVVAPFADILSNGKEVKS